MKNIANVKVKSYDKSSQKTHIFISPKISKNDVNNIINTATLAIFDRKSQKYFTLHTFKKRNEKETWIPLQF